MFSDERPPLPKSPNLSPSSSERDQARDLEIAKHPDSGRTVPVHPHPLANELTDEALPPLSAREEAENQAGIGLGVRRMLVVGGGVLLCFAGAGLIGSAVLFGERWQTALLGIGIALLIVAFFGAPILLAACTKVAQDEAVREEKTEHGDVRAP